MRNVGDLLREADPLQDEPMAPFEQRQAQRRVILAAASNERGRPRSNRRAAISLAAALALIVASLLGLRIWAPFIADVHAAVRFEVRLAEEEPAPGLREAKVSGSNRSVYLHDEVVVGNDDISAARLVQGSGRSQYSVSVEFNAAGAKKMQAATADRMGKLMAILLDGQVVMTPVIRSPIGASSMITGNFTKAQAERIVNGITTQR